MRTAYDKIPYDKPSRTPSEHLLLLQKRGLAVTDSQKAKHYLRKVGYYRLSGYFFPFYNKPQSNGERENFLSGAGFTHAVDLYVFDKKLRLLFLDALERIEVALRAEIVSILSKKDCWAHLKPHFLGHTFTRIYEGEERSHYDEWSAKYSAREKDSKEEFLTHYREKYSSPLPIWIAVELWDFGLLSKFLSGMTHADKTAMAEKYHISEYTVLVSWVRTLNNVRNICAHHSRLWNRSLSDSPALPSPGSVPIMEHLRQYEPTKQRLYAAAAIVQYFMRIISPGSTWQKRFIEHTCSFPDFYSISLQQAGFPPKWRQEELWQSTKSTAISKI